MDLRWPRRRQWLAGAAALAVLVAGGAAVATATAAGDPAVHRADAMLTGAGGVRLDTSYFTAGGSGRRPAVLIGHGFGGSKDDVRGQAESLARDGYAVLTWSARGFGDSGGQIGLNAPDGEVADVSKLIDWLADRPEVQLDAPGDPRVGVTGVSYGGAVSLLAAGYDHRVDAIAPRETYWNLSDALFPDGVYKKLWAGIFFTSGSASAPGSTGQTSPSAGAAAAQAAANPLCGRFEASICALYQRVAQAGKPDAAAERQLAALSPSAVAGDIKVPTLIVQGQTDSLFTLAQSDAMAKAIKANGAPVAVDWISGGHDGGDTEDGRIDARVTAWFDHYLKGDTGASTGPAFRVTRTGGLNSTDGSVTLRGASSGQYPGLGGTASRAVPLIGPEQRITNPAGGSPAAISAVPGAGALSQLSDLGASLSVDFPGQFAAFESAKLTHGLTLTGAPTVSVKVATNAPDTVLFAKLYDVAPDGTQTLPASLATPIRVTGSPQGSTVTIQLPAVDHDFVSGHRLRLVLAT